MMEEGRKRRSWEWNLSERRVGRMMAKGKEINENSIIKVKLYERKMKMEGNRGGVPAGAGWGCRRGELGLEAAGRRRASAFLAAEAQSKP